MYFSDRHSSNLAAFYSLEIFTRAAGLWNSQNPDFFCFLELINISSSLNKGNPDRVGVWLSDFYDFTSPAVFSLVCFRSRRYIKDIKHLRRCFTTFPNTSKFVRTQTLRCALYFQLCSLFLLLLLLFIFTIKKNSVLGVWKFGRTRS